MPVGEYSHAEITLTSSMNGLINKVVVTEDPDGMFVDFTPRFAVVFGDVEGKGVAAAHFLAGGDGLIPFEEIVQRTQYWLQLVHNRIQSGDYRMVHEPSDKERRGE